MAAPFVAGIAALFLQMSHVTVPSLSPALAAQLPVRGEALVLAVLTAADVAVQTSRNTRILLARSPHVSLASTQGSAPAPFAHPQKLHSQY